MSDETPPSAIVSTFLDACGLAFRSVEAGKIDDALAIMTVVVATIRSIAADRDKALAEVGRLTAENAKLARALSDANIALGRLGGEAMACMGRSDRT